MVEAEEARQFAAVLGEVLEFGGEMDSGELDFGTGLNFPRGVCWRTGLRKLGSGFV